jgi:hypothetical protein
MRQLVGGDRRSVEGGRALPTGKGQMPTVRQREDPALGVKRVGLRRPFSGLREVYCRAGSLATGGQFDDATQSGDPQPVPEMVLGRILHTSHTNDTVSRDYSA